MIVRKTLIRPNFPLSIDEELDFTGFDYSECYPIDHIEKCHISGQFEKSNNYIVCHFVLNGSYVLRDSLDDSRFSASFEQEEYADILESEDEEGDGYIFEGEDIDLCLLAIMILRSYLPIKLVNPNGNTLVSGDGYKVIKEGEEEKPEYNPAFDALKDFDAE